MQKKKKKWGGGEGARHMKSAQKTKLAEMSSQQTGKSANTLYQKGTSHCSKSAWNLNTEHEPRA